VQIVSTQEEEKCVDSLRVRNLRKEYPAPDGTLAVLKDVSFDLSPGNTVAVVGPSGSGKSTLLNIIGALDTPTAGSVRLGDTEVTELAGDDLYEFRGRRVGFVFQDHHLLPQCTALENVAVPALALGGHDDEMERAAELLDQVGLSDRAEALPSRLSGGERQRVATARALMNRPPLLLCDEPTGNLDKETGNRLGEVFARLADQQGVMLVVVTHDIDFAERFRPVMRLRNGRLKKDSS
jgi:lipoprotein-releasing system ATP-binding protein